MTNRSCNEFFRANMFLLVGRDRDLLVDTGMGLARLSRGDCVPTPASRCSRSQPTSMSIMSARSTNSPKRAGPRVQRAAFAAMDDALTYADMYSVLAEPVATLPAPDWKVDAYQLTPAPLTRLLGEGDIVDLGDRQFRVLHLPGHSAQFDRAARRARRPLLQRRCDLRRHADRRSAGFRPGRLSRHHGPHHRSAGADRPWRPRRKLFRRTHARDRAALHRGERAVRPARRRAADSGLPDGSSNPIRRLIQLAVCTRLSGPIASLHCRAASDLCSLS